MSKKAAVVKSKSYKVLEDAIKLCEDERDSEAEDLVKKQLEIDPDNLELMTYLGVIQTRLCKDQKAETTFRSVLVLNPTYEDAICGLGRLLDQSLRIGDAEELYREFLGKNPAGHYVLEDLCRLLLTENRTDEALFLARSHIENYRGHLQAYNAIRYILHILEDQLEDELYDDRENEYIFSKLMDNLLEQIEIANSMERNVKLPENMNAELEDDRTRLFGEIEQLVDSAPGRQISISSEIISRINQTKSKNRNLA